LTFKERETNPTRRIYRIVSLLVILALLQFAPQARRIDSSSDNGLVSDDKAVIASDSEAISAIIAETATSLRDSQ
jgi:hypothetical protein